MKKLLAMMLVVVMLFSFAACGGSDKPFDTVSDYIASDEMQEAIATLQEGLLDSGMEIEIVGEDDKLVYVYTFVTQIDITDEAVDALATALDGQASTFEEVAAEVESVVDVDNAAVVVRYLNADGSTIYEQEFTAK